MTNDNEIINCLNNTEGKEHIGIYCTDKNGNFTTVVKLTDLVDLINRQKAENERLQEYEKGIKENKFVEMPCKVGQTVYYIFQFSNKQILPFVRKGKVRKIYCKNNKMDFTVDVELTDAKEKGIMRSWSFSDFGSKIFTNQKQADFWCSNYDNLVKETGGKLK